MMPKRVALIGTAPSSAQAPWNDPTWEIWGVGLRPAIGTRADRWFELHRLDGEPPEWAAEWRRRIREGPDKCPLWMFYPEHDLGQDVVTMDATLLSQKYGSFFMTSSFSWMMAQAIEEQRPEIGLWGVDMEYGTEYRQQRVGLRHFIDLAKVVGIPVTRVITSGIALEPIPYPMWQDDPVLAKNALRRKALEETKRNADRHFHDFQERVLRFEGGRIELRTLLDKTTDMPPELREAYEKRLKAIDSEILSLSEVAQTVRDDVMRAEGALSEVAWLNDYLQP
jgi:hypothetical protein